MKWLKTSDWSIASECWHISRSGPEPYRYTLWHHDLSRGIRNRMVGHFATAEEAKRECEGLSHRQHRTSVSTVQDDA